MLGSKPDGFARRISRAVTAQTAQRLSDRELLERFLSRQEEAAFAALVERHGAMVLGVCRRVLRHAQDAEDAFQAAFLVLARKARSIRDRGCFTSWLYGVAYRVAASARRQRARRQAREVPVGDVPQGDAAAKVTWREVQTVIDEELNRLPEKYRSPLVLCYLEGKARDEAAQQLGWAPGVFRGRLERGRERLRARLARRGLTLSAGLFATAFVHESVTAAGPAALVRATVRGAMGVVTGEAAAISPRVAALAEGALQAMLVTRIRAALFAVVAAAVLGGAAAVLAWAGAGDRGAGPQKQATPQKANGKAPAPLVYALIHLQPQRPRPGDVAAPGELEVYRRTQAALVKSRLVLNAALRKPEVAGLEIVRAQADPVSWLERKLVADFPGEALILRVGLSGDKPRQLAAVVNAVADAYLREAVDHERLQRLKRLGQLKYLRDQYEDTVRDKRQILRRLARAKGTVADQEARQAQRSALYRELEHSQREHLRIRLAQAAEKARLEVLGAGKATDERKAELAALAAQEQLLRQEVRNAKDQLESFETAQADLKAVHEEVEQAEEVVRRVAREVAALHQELEAPQRARLLEAAEAPRGK